jgi:hypothetical protein
MRLSEIQRRDVQRLADQLLADGKSASTIRNALMPLRVIFRRAIENGIVAVTPATSCAYRRSRGGATGSPRPKKRQS